MYHSVPVKTQPLILAGTSMPDWLKDSFVLQTIPVINESFALNMGDSVLEGSVQSTSVNHQAERTSNGHIPFSSCHRRRDGNCRCNVMLDRAGMGYAMPTQLAMSH